MRSTYWLIVFITAIVMSQAYEIHAQCSGSTPVFTADLTSSASATWTSSSTTRSGTCCSASGVTCVRFNATFHANAKAFVLEIVGSTSTSSAIKVGCGSSSYNLRDTICITGGSTNTITFCRSGSTGAVQYRIRSVAKAIATAGNDTTICASYNRATLNGSITNGSGNGIWSGGTGRYIPDNTTLDAIYVPSPSEISAGSATLILTPTGNGTCTTTKADTVVITIAAAPNPVISGTTNACASTSGYTYSVTSVSGNSYVWAVPGGTINSGQGTNSINVTWGSVGPGFVSVTQTNTAGCSTTRSVTTFSRFDFNTNSINTATIGPNATSSDADAYSDGMGYRITSNCGGSKGADVTIAGSTFDKGSMCMTFSWQRDENDATFFSRGGTRFYISGGVIHVQYRVSNGSGGFITHGPTSTGYTAINDDVMRRYTFCYDSMSGVGKVMINDSIVWSQTTTAGRELYWTSAGNAVLGQSMDGACSWRTLVDYADFATPIVIKQSPSSVTITGTASVCQGTQNVKYSIPASGNTYSWSVTGGTIVGSSTADSVKVNWGTSGSSGTVQVVETNSLGCNRTTIKTITLNATPNPVISGLNIACAGDENSYSVAPVSGTTYSWTVTGGTITTGNGTSTVFVEWGGAGSATLRITQTNTSTGCSATYTKNLTIYARPGPQVIQY